jgi:multicomponent Na+:H+ antiporter subunit F
MSGTSFLELATTFALWGQLLAGSLTFLRLLLGPTLPDRILALDTMTTLGIGMIAVFAIRSGVMLYIDIAIAVGLVGFLATVAFARYVAQTHSDD